MTSIVSFTHSRFFVRLASMLVAILLVAGSLTPVASVSASPLAGSIFFLPGTTAGAVQGTIGPGQVLTYTLDASGAQPMVLIMDAPNHDVTLGLSAPDGSVLINPASRWTNWQGMLPATGTYTIQVIGGATTENFSLTIKIAQVVNFASDTSSISLSGTTASGFLYEYAAYCNAGQTLSASLNVPSSTAWLGIFGIGFGMLLNDSARLNSWSGVLPQSQTYVIEVVPNNNQVVNFGLTISCTGVAVNPGAQGGSGGNLGFAPGSTAAVAQGTIGPGQVVTYTVYGYQYQPLLVQVDSTYFDVTLGVRDPNGALMFDPAKKYINWRVPLHITGIYTIQVIGGSHTEKYMLTAKLPKHVYLGNGVDTVTVSGDTLQGFIVSYAINGNAGETLSASLNVPPTVAYLDIFGVGSSALLSFTEKANSWSGMLSDTQLYVIEVIPRGGWTVGYSLTISLK